MPTAMLHAWRARFDERALLSKKQLGSQCAAHALCTKSAHGDTWLGDCSLSCLCVCGAVCLEIGDVTCEVCVHRGLWISWRKWFIGLRFDFVCAIHSRARDVASKKNSKIKLNVPKLPIKRHKHIWPPPRFLGVWKTSGLAFEVWESSRGAGWPSPRCRHLHAAPAALMPNQQLQFWASVQERGWSRPRCASPPRGGQPPLVRRPAAPGNATKCDGDRF